jgi:hypothetical protein
MEVHNGGVKTKQQMADEYGVCRKTFVKLLTEKNIKLGRILISPREQLKIYQKLGLPDVRKEFPNFPKSSQ